MRYPIAIEPGDDTHAFGVIVPDLPGCYSAGDSSKRRTPTPRNRPNSGSKPCSKTEASFRNPSSPKVLLQEHPEWAD